MLWASLESWAAANKFAEADDAALLSAIEDALSTSNAVEAWRRAILSGIAAASSSKSSAFPAAFWRWAASRPATLSALVAHLSQDIDLEARLSDAAPREVNRDAGEAVMALAAPKLWLRLHGTAAGASLTPPEAIRRQLSLDADRTNLDGVRAALRRATPAEMLAIALELGEPHVIRIAAEEVARTPHLLTEIDFVGVPAQEVWARALAINAEAWRGPADPLRSFFVVIKNLLDGGPASAELINRLATTPVADLSEYPRRTEVWPKVAGPARGNLLRATAAGWLERASSGDIPYTPDSQLEAALLAGDELDRVLRSLAPSRARAAVQIISGLPAYDESRFLRWLGDLTAARRTLSVPDADALGRLVLDRNWRRAVDQLVQLARKGRDDVKLALRTCRDMIGTFTRWSLGLSSISNEDKWMVLEDLAAELYPLVRTTTNSGIGLEEEMLTCRLTVVGNPGGEMRLHRSGGARDRGSVA
jgi:hypothetical protein